jgi:hypothetical protein
MRNVRVFAAAVLIVAAAGVTSAHHSVIGYDRDRTITVQGNVVEWRWRNPHCFLVLDVKDDKGAVVKWTAETNSTITLQSAGLSRNSFKAGDEVTIVVFPNSKGAPQGILRKVMTSDGKVVLDQSGLEGPASAVNQ